MGGNFAGKMYVQLVTAKFQTIAGDRAPVVVVVTTVVVAVVTVVWILFSKRSSKKKNGRPPVPPGSLGLPFIGETPEFIDHLNKHMLTAFFEKKAAKYGRTFKTSILGSPVVILDPPVGTKFLFANEGTLVENSWPKPVIDLLGHDSLMFKKGEEYKIARRHFAMFLSPDAMTSYLPRIERDVIDHLATFWKDGLEFSALKSLTSLMFILVADLCLSITAGPEAEQMEKIFNDWVGGILQLPINLPGFAFHRALKARAALLRMEERLLTKRKLDLEGGLASPTQDLMSNMITRGDEKGRLCSDAEIKDNILDFMFGGHATTSALVMALMFLAKYPEVHQRLKEEHDGIAANKKDGELLTVEDVRSMKYTWRVLQETMRLQPPVSGTFREALTDLEFNGYSIYKGWKFYWSPHYTHTDPNLFSNPMQFDPSRFEGSGPTPYTYVPFGGGTRTCAGYEFAKMEMLVVLHHVVAKYKWTLTDPDEPIFRDPMPRTRKGTPIKLTKL